MEPSKTLSLILKKILGKIPLKKMILFGSFAKGTPHKDSDLDLCIITKKTSQKKVDLLKQIRILLMEDIDFPLDILLYDPKEFSERAKSETSLENTIKKEGKVIYG